MTQGQLDDLLGFGGGDKELPQPNSPTAKPEDQAEQRGLVPTGGAKMPAVFLGLGSHGGIVMGLEDFTPAQLNLEPPRLRIVHGTQRRGQIGEPGQLKLGSECFDFVDCIIVRAHSGRAFIEGEGADARVYCASSDNKTPDPKVAQPKDRDCDHCEFGKWEQDAAGKRHPPPCQEFIALLGVLPQKDYKPFWFICSKTARKPALEFVRAVQKVREEGVAHIAQLQVRITTEEQSKSGIFWYTPIFSVLDRDDPKLHQELFEQARVLRYLPRLAASAEVGGEEVPVATPDAEVVGSDDDIPF